MKGHICPWYVGYILVNPLRRLFQSPEEIIGSYVKEGMMILDVGSGMGFFSLPLAKLVGEKGRVVCVDIQSRMINKLRKRAARKKLLHRIETRICTETSLKIDDLNEKIDFALAFAIVHEVPDQNKFFNEIFNSLKMTGTLLLSEPKGHVTKEEFDNTLSMAKSVGFKISDSLKIWRSYSVVLHK